MSSTPLGRLSSVEPSVSIVIPVYNGGENFRQCLSSLAQFVPASTEIIVVIDGGTDGSLSLAQQSGAKVLTTSTNSGPAVARNLGAKAAQGDILFFIDADVTVNAKTLDQVVAFFCDHPEIAAIIGSYDDAPRAANFLSQYKNLFHHYMHQTAHEEASTFWGACGAIRRHIFLEIGGFDEVYRYPSIEDIELGYRLKRMGHQIQLCKSVQVKHLKHWGVISLLRAEVFYRAIPWTELIWRDRQFINDLNLQLSSRISVLLTYELLAMLIVGSWWQGAWVVAGMISLLLLTLNLSVYQFFQAKRGVWFSLRVIPWHWLYFFYSGLAFAIGTVRYHLFQSPKTGKAQISQVQSN